MSNLKTNKRLNHDSPDLQDEHDLPKKNQGNQVNPINQGSDNGSEWKTYKLGEIADVFTGFPFKGEKYHDSEGTRVLRGENVTIGCLRWDTIKHWNEDFSEFEKYSLQEKDIVIGMDGSRVGKNRAQIKNKDLPLLLAQRVARIRAKESFNQDFLAHIIKSEKFENYVLAIHTGTSIPHISATQIKEFEFITISDLPTQTAIAQILTSLDDKIELNLQMNQTLEAMAQAIFKEWFVDFKFPKMSEHDFNDYKIDKINIDKEKNPVNQINHINPVQDSGLPKGWRMGSILEIATLLSGGTPKTDVSDYWNGEINWISAKDITNSNSQFILDTEKTITELGVKNSATKLLPKFTTIISARGTVGNYCMLSKEMAISQSNYGLKSNSNFDYFLFLMVENMILLMKAYSYGTVFDTITTKTFQEMEIVIPTNEVIKEFEKTIAPIYAKVLSNQFQIQTLTQIRDSLLPKLMSGKIKVGV